MSVYVDNAFIAADVSNGARVLSGRWCHMTADSRDELDAMADRIGLRRDWIQHPGTSREHYDVTEPKRRAAVAAGAVERDWREMTVERLSLRRAALFTVDGTTVVNRNSDEYDVYIGRGSDWGNPFRIGEHGSRQSVIEQFEAHLRQRPDLLARLGELRGRRLGCFCAPLPCHGNVLARYAEMNETQLQIALETPLTTTQRPVRSGQRGVPMVPPRSFVAIDFETANPSRASVIQIGVTRVLDGVVGRPHTSPVRPPDGHRSWHAGQFRIHGLPTAYIVGAPEWPDVMLRLVRLASMSDGAVLPLVAHNAAFEKSVINKISEITGVTSPWGNDDYFCTLKYARQQLPELPKHRLDYLAEYLDLGAFTHHDAGEDAATTARLLLRLAAV